MSTSVSRCIDVLSLVLLTSLAACSPRSFSPQSYLKTGQKVASVEVRIFEGRLASERQASAERNRVEEQLKLGTIDALDTLYKMYSPDGSLSLEITITDFRLRHGALKLFTGLWSGRDYVTVDVAVKKQGTVIHSFSTLQKGGGSPFSISQTSRANALCVELGRRIAHTVARAG